MNNKINQMSKMISRESKINLYSAYEKQFNYFLNPESVRENMEEINMYHIPDSLTEKKLKDLVEEPMDSINAFIGYKGMGKTTDIKHSYQISNSAVKLDNNKKVIFFPVFCKNFVTMDISYEFVVEDITKRISSICSAMEDEIPELREDFVSDEGQKNFLSFIKCTNPKDLEDLTYRERMTDDVKLNFMQDNSPFVYYATKLKYYLLNPKCKYNRLFIILDNIESIPFDERKKFLLQYFRFFSCIRNFPYYVKEGNDKIYINMLVSLRPETYNNIIIDDALSSYQVTNTICKVRSVDLAKFFEKKNKLVPESIKRKEEKKWEEAYSILATLSEKFDKKYSKMMKRLSYMSIPNTLELYRKVLNNITWTVEKDDGREFQYVFNNITVIRSIACGNNLVYFNDSENLIPNIIIENHETEKSSVLIGVYILNYFIMHRAGYQDYGQNFLKKENIIADFSHVFGKEIEKDVESTLKYFLEKGILKYGLTTNDVGSINYYVSSRGEEIWEMFTTDSVLMEMYREDFVFLDGITRLPSKELMDNNEQTAIFLDLIKMENILCDEEEKMLNIALTNQSYSKYISMFGNKSLTEHMFEGIQRSLEYSGKVGEPQIITEKEKLWQRIQRMSER